MNNRSSVDGEKGIDFSKSTTKWYCNLGSVVVSAYSKSAKIV